MCVQSKQTASLEYSMLDKMNIHVIEIVVESNYDRIQHLEITAINVHNSYSYSWEHDK